MLQSISVITLGVAELARSRRFYAEGFGWAPVFANDEIVFYQMNGLVLGTWLADALARDMRRPTAPPGSTALAHNVRDPGEVATVMAALVRAGGRELRRAEAPPHGGLAGYVADPDGHAWEIAFNPAWTIAEDGRVTFGL